jgi:hypothetical protein
MLSLRSYRKEILRAACGSREGSRKGGGMMGVENNEAILATTWNQEIIGKVKEWIHSLPEEQQQLFAFVDGLVNGKTTILLAPCGSKKGWAEDKVIEDLRNRFIEYLITFNYDDGSSPFDWVEVGYGEFGQKVLRGNNTNRYSDKEYESEEIA